MNIYDQMIYDDIDIYLRQGEMGQQTLVTSTTNLKAFFEYEMLEKEFLELLNAKTILLQNKKNATENNLIKFKAFMCICYLKSSRMNQEIYNKIFEFIKETPFFVENIAFLIMNKFSTLEIFDYVFDEETFDKAIRISVQNPQNVIRAWLQNHPDTLDKGRILKLSELTNCRLTDLIKFQKMDISTVEEILSKTDDTDFENTIELVCDLVSANQPIKPLVAMSILSQFNPNSMSWLTSPDILRAVDKLLKNDSLLINDYEIRRYLITMYSSTFYGEDANRARLIRIIFSFPLDQGFIGQFMQKEPLDELEKIDCTGLNPSTSTILYSFTEREIFLPQTAKDLFLF